MLTLLMVSGSYRVFLCFILSAAQLLPCRNYLVTIKLYVQTSLCFDRVTF